MSREQQHDEEHSVDHGAHDAHHHDGQPTATTMLGAVASRVGAPLLQRKIAQRAQLRSAGAASGTASVVQRKEVLPTGKDQFSQMWENHPHNYQSDESQNTQSADLLEEQGLPAWLGNTCAVRLSTMLNRMGLHITPEKTKAAGLTRAPMYSKKTKEYYIIAASEMWTYLSKNFRKADFDAPASGAYKDAAAFEAGFNSDIKPQLAGRKGIVAFETIFGYGGTGHVDLFDGEALSDAANWYPSKKIHLWYISVP